jgi:hypothetical protein
MLAKTERICAGTIQKKTFSRLIPTFNQLAICRETGYERQTVFLWLFTEKCSKLAPIFQTELFKGCHQCHLECTQLRRIPNSPLKAGGVVDLIWRLLPVPEVLVKLSEISRLEDSVAERRSD